MKMFNVCKTGMIWLPYSEKNYDDMFSRFETIPACHRQTDGQTDGPTDRETFRIAISISRVSVLMRDKNLQHSAQSSRLILFVSLSKNVMGV